ncbi:histidine phosphatase family protein [Oenococcus alcoholitolerans]|uniref:histidine phosphatase family protein n=1 Tax=Oenococcus alcoholitolerans TaxID=931074 RepID=UPI003F710614
MTENGINVYFVRHGQTYFNYLGRYQGWSDIDLTDKGIEDGKNAGKRLASIHFKAAFSSDLSRAYRTGQLILNENEAASADLIRDSDFREVFFGSAEGLKNDQVIELLNQNGSKDTALPQIGYNDLIKKYGFNGLLDIFKEYDPNSFAENAAEFNARLDHGLNMIRQNFNDGDNVLIATHGSFMRALADRFSDDKELASKRIYNGAVSKLIFETKKDGKVKIAAWNDIDTFWG